MPQRGIGTTPHISVINGISEKRFDFAPGRSLQEILEDNGIRSRRGCSGNGTCGLCVVHVSGKVNEPTRNEHIHFSDLRLHEGYRLACQTIPSGDVCVSVPERGNKDSWEIIECEPLGPSSSSNVNGERGKLPAIGLAVDLGTTNLQISLVDLDHRSCIIRGKRGNPQIEYGSDVISRLMYRNQDPETNIVIRDAVVKALKEGMEELCERAGVLPRDVSHVMVVGNTAMLFLLAADNPHILLEPRNWMDKIDDVVWNNEKLRSDLRLSPSVKLSIVPPMVGFIGSDIVADIVNSELLSYIRPVLLIDFGTNTEMALWTGRELFITAAAGGPALEAMGISCGLPAGFRCAHNAVLLNGKFEMKVAGSGDVVGICGSGLIDVVAELRRNGILDEKGRFKDGSGAFPLTDNEELHLTKKDVDEIMKAKAAVAVGIRILLSKACLSAIKLEKIIITGCFGKSLNLANAVEIGLLPKVSESSYSTLDKGAMVGCEMMISSDSASDWVERIGRITKSINLAGENDFDSLFEEALYLHPIVDRNDDGANFAEINIEEFIKVSQYLLGIKSSVPEMELAKVIPTFLRADIAGMAHYDDHNNLVLDQWSKPNGKGLRDLIRVEILESTKEVLSTGFFYELKIPSEGTNLILLPVNIEHETTHVLIVGYAGDVHFDKKSINVHLAVASLIGTILQRLKNEEELKRHRTELSNLVEEKTEELKRSYFELRLSKDAYQMANKKLAILSSITRHDMMNQLVAIRGNLSLLSASTHDIKSLDRIKRIDNEAERIFELIRFTKDYEEMGVKEPSFHNLFEVVEKAAKGFQTDLVHADDDLKRYDIFSDPMLVKVFFNLIDNSIRHGERVRIIDITASEINHELHVLYQDDGIGIDADIKESLFRKGFGKNTGLGLFLIKEILGITGIKISENGVFGKGARFEIVVPMESYQIVDL